jgi:hypothetical protein
MFISSAFVAMAVGPEFGAGSFRYRYFFGVIASVSIHNRLRMGRAGNLDKNGFVAGLGEVILAWRLYVKAPGR